MSQTYLRLSGRLADGWQYLTNCLLKKPHGQSRIRSPLIQFVARKDRLCKRDAADGVARADAVFVGTRGPLEYFSKPIRLCGVFRRIKQYRCSPAFTEEARPWRRPG